MSFEIDDKNSSNSMIVKDILNEFPFEKSEIKEDQKEAGGIPLSRLIDYEKHQNLLQILKCKICLNILLNPYDCSKCGNTFCCSCITRLKDSNKSCPFGCTDYDIIPSSFAIKKFLNQLNFSCLNKDNGCEEIIPYSNIEQHDKNCECINSVCPNENCGIKMPWNLLKNHIQNECNYTLFECDKCRIKLSRNEIQFHKKMCGSINNEFEKMNFVVNKINNEDINKKKDEFNIFMNDIENMNFFYQKEINKKEENKDDNKNDKNFFNNNDMNILVKSLIYVFSRKMSFIEDKINKINLTMKQFSENNLIFYQSINDELENINEKISNLNKKEKEKEKDKESIKNNKDKESSSDKNSISKINSNTFSTEVFEFNQPKITNNKKTYKKTIFPNNNNKNEKLMLSNSSMNSERHKSVRNLEKAKTSYPKELTDLFHHKNKNDLKSKKKGTTINNLINNEKFIKGMKSTKYMEKLKGIENKKTNLIISTGNLEDKVKNEYINTNIINEQRNNYIISNNFNTINSLHDKAYSEKSSSNTQIQNLSGGNNQDFLISNNFTK